jgi:Holliday junction resolvase
MMVRKKEFLSAGGFDSAMKEAAGADLCLKVRERGWKVLYAPLSSVALDYDAIAENNAGNNNAVAGILYNKWNGRIERDLNKILKEDGFNVIKKDDLLIASNV